jgi:hypothetical protein
MSKLVFKCLIPFKIELLTTISTDKPTSEVYIYRCKLYIHVCILARKRNKKCPFPLRKMTFSHYFSCQYLLLMNFFAFLSLLRIVFPFNFSLPFSFCCSFSDQILFFSPKMILTDAPPPLLDVFSNIHKYLGAEILSAKKALPSLVRCMN